ncbi:MAG TPA: M18 family aminopeptidase [Halanaerobiales bacterium]|nr:M18 family aminopeptidase [Halanaerobiales bacterium]
MKHVNTDSLIEYLKNGPSPFHVVDKTADILENNGYQELKIQNKWDIKENKKYYVIKNDSAIIAFNTGSKEKLKDGFKIVGAHTDSPSIKIKPQPEFKDEDYYLKLNTEVYGGPILNTWFDRPLTLAGRVSVLEDGQLNNININFEDPLMVIPNLAIHLNREINKGQEIDKQKDLIPIMKTIKEDEEIEGYLIDMIARRLEVENDKIMDFDLYLRDTEDPIIMGSEQEFLNAGQIDDLGMAHAGLKALLNTENSGFKLLVLFDNEEIGSNTDVGADSPLLSNLLERIVYALDGSREDYLQIIENTFMISADMAHAVHPNYADKHDPTNKPVINQGPVLKISSNRRYTTDSYSGGYIKKLCAENNIPYQNFVNHSNERGGSTIGPLNLRHLGVKSVDIGNPVLSMHSIRELYGLQDHESMIELLTVFYND